MKIPSNRGQGFLDEFQDFLSFLTNLWGILAGISVFFPLSNVLVSVIPLQTTSDDGALVQISPAFVTVTSTLVTLFIVLWTFSARAEQTKMKSSAAVSFLLGMLSLGFYMILYELKLSAFDLWGWESDDPRHILVEIPLLIGYAAFFASTTRAFMLLGLLEFYRQTKQG